MSNNDNDDNNNGYSIEFSSAKSWTSAHVLQFVATLFDIVFRPEEEVEVEEEETDSILMIQTAC